MTLKEKQKIVVYVTAGDKLLAFYHYDYPEVGYQVPAGTVESGERPVDAARRELMEEAGLDVPVEQFVLLGQNTHDMRPFKPELHCRSYFHVALDDTGAGSKTWTHYELHTGTPTKFCYEWISTQHDVKRLLSVGQGAFVQRISDVTFGKRPGERVEFTTLNAKLRAFRQTRIHDVKQLLKLLPFESLNTHNLDTLEVTQNARYAALEQAFYSITQGVDHDENEQLSFGIELLQSAPHVSNETIYVSQRCAHQLYSSGFESPPYVSTFDNTDAASEEKRKKILQAMEVCHALGFGETLEYQVGNVCLLQDKDLISATDSYTLSGLPGTIYCDYVDNTYRLAEIVLHEATHNWLNEALRAHSVKLDPVKLYYSPWRKKPRPAAGIIHAALVFSRLVCFFEEVIAQCNTSAYEQIYFTKKLEAERRVIIEHIEMLTEVLGVLDQAPTIKCLIAEEINRAVNLR